MKTLGRLTKKVASGTSVWNFYSDDFGFHAVREDMRQANVYPNEEGLLRLYSWMQSKGFTKVELAEEAQAEA